MGHDSSVIIIGAGIAGLSAGCYLQMNGYKTQIFEMHDEPGGLCASWTRNGFNVNGGFHSLVGRCPGTDFHQLWQELGAIQGRDFVAFDDFIRFESSDGKVLMIHSDLDQLQEHLLDVAPEDHKLILEFMSAARSCLRFEIPTLLKAPELYKPIDGLKALSQVFPHLPLLRKWMRMSMTELANRCKSTVLREAFSFLWFHDSPAFFFLMTLAMMHKRDTGYPIGGPLEFTKAIERRYLGLGGTCHYNSRITKIVVENNHATGIQLEDGRSCHSETIISAADSYHTIFDFLDGKYANRKIRKRFSNLPIFPPLISLSFGLNKTLDLTGGASTGINFPLEEPAMVAGEEMNRLGIRIHDFDPSAAPPGKTLVRCLIPSDYAYWKKLGKDPEHYALEKKDILSKITTMLENRFRGFTDQIVMRDIATPLTFRNYTGNWQGSHQGWMIIPKTRVFHMKKELPGLANFYMAGHWVEPGGGIPLAAVSGRNVTQIICKRDKLTFKTATPSSS